MSTINKQIINRFWINRIFFIIYILDIYITVFCPTNLFFMMHCICLVVWKVLLFLTYNNLLPLFVVVV